jgi:hypothetical protein
MMRILKKSRAFDFKLQQVILPARAFAQFRQ